ncbi:hypothetical protein A3A38_04480 [Candidatus Kaiserbacteria bacterium RIFCSPLOWO2_01_FULL_53_17]|uniref:Uncharacterized protein n=1 Tax=Candidatus Kaiserbacteria bacterium RIFCSPLOWO2_01_FULL_53_17 TaxID=1798511 RepID=A0A1F6EFY4_9BACT|nr:MAG: hypothetical protein A3A38_04480 [Candidatus Kaiserbacteria bacterium RIFCSPLOWO2_01_FULL_53_17]
MSKRKRLTGKAAIKALTKWFKALSPQKKCKVVERQREYFRLEGQKAAARLEELNRENRY